MTSLIEQTEVDILKMFEKFVKTDASPLMLRAKLHALLMQYTEEVKAENPKTPTTKESFTKALESIGWAVRGLPDREFVVNHLGENTHWWICYDRLNFQSKGFDNPHIVFRFSDCLVEILEETTVCLSASDGVFILFPNYDLKDTRAGLSHGEKET